MFAHIDEMTDEPVRAELTNVGRVRIAYSASVVLTLDIGEAVDLVAAVVDVLAAADHPARAPLRGDENTSRAEAELREALQ